MPRYEAEVTFRVSVIAENGAQAWERLKKTRLIGCGHGSSRGPKSRDYTHWVVECRGKEFKVRPVKKTKGRSFGCTS